MSEAGSVCLDCPEWMWDEQPNGMYGIDAHPDVKGHADPPHPWRGAQVVPVSEEAAAPDAHTLADCRRAVEDHIGQTLAAAPDAGLREAVIEVIALLDDRFGEDAPDEFYAWHERATAALAAHPAPAPRRSIGDYRHGLPDDPAPAPDPDWPKVEPGTACSECGAILHGYPCIHHKDGCSILESRWAAPAGPAVDGEQLRKAWREHMAAVWHGRNCSPGDDDCVADIVARLAGVGR